MALKLSKTDHRIYISTSDINEKIYSSVSFWNFNFTIPVRDLVGESDGFRRPGYVISVEPGISYMKGNVTGTLYFPIALIRNLTQSLTDIENSTPEKEVHGNAAFADYLINVGIVWRIPKKVPAVFNGL